MHIQLVLAWVQALAKYAFGLGLLQMFLCTLAFSLFSLPVGKGIGTQILEVVSLGIRVWSQAACRPGPVAVPCSTAARVAVIGVLPQLVPTGAESSTLNPAVPAAVQVFRASPQLAAIRSVDEAVVIGVALSLSSSAFVLQLLNERGEMATKFGSATLGILLMQARPADLTRASLRGLTHASLPCILAWTLAPVWWHPLTARRAAREV